MNMPDLNEARKRTKDKVNILYDEYKVPENVKILVMVKAMHFLLMDVK